jgi:ubiquitin C-terminal hydrolase
LSIKRFTNEGHKVRGKLAWNLDNFNLGSVLAFTRNPFGEDQTFSSEYETFAVIEHHGSLQGGHYTMYAKQTDKWQEYDDSSITEVAPDRVVSADSYILFLLPKTEKESMNLSFLQSVQSLRERITMQAREKAKEA